MDNLRRTLELLMEKQDNMQSDFQDKIMVVSNDLVKQTTLLESHFKADEESAKEILEMGKSIQEINKTLITTNLLLNKQEQNLRQHMRRTELLENRVDPLEKYHALVVSIFKVVVIFVGIVGTITTIYQAFK